jgi:predicted permease
MESVFLALIGGLLGVLLAYWGLQLILTTSSGRLPRAVEIHIDIRVLLFTLTVCLGTAVLFGLLPWFHAARTNLANALRDQRIASSVSRHRILGVNARSLLVVVQVAMAIVLLIGASLMIESFKHLRQVELGFEPSNLLTMQIALPPSRYDSDRKKAAFYQELVQRVATVPGVRGVAVAASLPTASSIQFPIQIAGHPLMNTGLRPLGQWQAISNNYFRSLGTALQRGREFTEHDNADSSWVVIINESLARRFWPDYPRGQDPIGQHMLFGPGNSISPEIVGVVADVHEESLDADNGPEAYMPLAQRCPQTMHLLVRTEGEPRRMENAIRAQVVGVDPDQPVSKVRTMEEVLETSVASQRLTILVLVFFAGVALVLSTVGIYGVISYSVAQRTKELGIRMALGAQARDVLGLVLQQALTLTLSGIGIGIAGAFLLTRLLGRLLFHVSPTDPLTFGLIAIAFSLVAMIASYLPARRAMRVNVVVALQ